MDLLFNLAHWHAMAKLRQHTDLSLSVLELVTIQLGESLSKFQATTCSDYDTQELKREETARVRRAENPSNPISKPATKNKNETNVADAEAMVGEPATSSSNTSLDETITPKTKKIAGRLRKTLNLNTYKDHSLGDYVETIRQYGTVDSYSTESVNPCTFGFFFFMLTHIPSDGT